MKSFPIAPALYAASLIIHGVTSSPLPADLSKKDPEPCYLAASNHIYCRTNEKRDDNNNIALSANEFFVKRVDNTATEYCWEAPDGQVHCSLDKRFIGPEVACSTGPDGIVHCVLPSLESTDNPGKRDGLAELEPRDTEKKKPKGKTGYPHCGAPICFRDIYEAVTKLVTRDTEKKKPKGKTGYPHCGAPICFRDTDGAYVANELEPAAPALKKRDTEKKKPKGKSGYPNCGAPICFRDVAEEAVATEIEQAVAPALKLRDTEKKKPKGKTGYPHCGAPICFRDVIDRVARALKGRDALPNNPEQEAFSIE
ncbi:MAG: hypothetical protein Q9220_006751 [cf. Caloplaca sp. 1 TL-2023]